MLAVWEYFWTEADWTDTSKIIAETGSFNITGQAATLKINFVAAQGTHTGTGQGGVLNIGMPAGAGSFAITGQSANLVATVPRVLTADAGTFIITGFDANLIDSTPPERTTGAGGGGRLDEDFWEARERYIKRMLQVEDVELSHAPTVEQLESIDALSDEHLGSQLPVRDVRPSPYASISLERALELQTRAVFLAREARTRAELKRAGELVAATSRSIARLKDQHEIENVAAVMALLF